MLHHGSSGDYRLLLSSLWWLATTALVIIGFGGAFAGVGGVVATLIANCGSGLLSWSIDVRIRGSHLGWCRKSRVILNGCG